MVRVSALAVILALSAAPALAGQDFAPYEGPDAFKSGLGGTKLVTDGVEFWTTGTPPRPFQVLGVLTDVRGSGLFSGSPTGKGVARRIRALGGDAAIIVGSDTRAIGALINQYGQAMTAERRTTQMIVVRYAAPEQ